MSVAVEFRAVSRHYGSVRAVDAVDLTIADGEFFSLLGPSGSGKTTCLRLVAGFELPTSGRILLHGEDASRLPPYERDVNTVFQDYALFPHLSVQENVEYGLRVKGVDRAARAREAGRALELVRLSGFGSRRPGQLSGGQRQRVALARALVNRPRVLLLDEPLGALDLKLREQMQTELKSLQRQLGITFVFVTHDQGEALSMSDRVAVFNEGRIEQVDSPRDLYARPRTEFVAGFVGTANVVRGELARRITGSDRAFSIRPEQILTAPAQPEPGGGMRSGSVPEAEHVELSGRVSEILYHGPTSRLAVEVDGASLWVTVPGPGAARPGDPVTLAWPRSAMVTLEARP
jgi:putative spermidine/putrescine transport system ATP-binding protein